MRSIIVMCAVVFLLGGCSTHHKRYVAVMDFENNVPGETYAGLATAIPEFLMESFTNAERIGLVERQDMNRFLGARYGEDYQRLRHDRWREIGQKLDADYFITGSISMLENNFIMTARLYSVTTGKVVPGSAKTVSCARAAELYPQARILAKSLINQIESLQPKV